MKQSLKSYKTILNDPIHFDDFVKSDLKGKRLIAHCSSIFERQRVSDHCSKNENAVILIGPEGDFSEEEISIAITNGFRSVHLGPSRLRTETAGIAACHSIYFINQ